MPITRPARHRAVRTGAACTLTGLVAVVALTGCGTEDLVGDSVARTGASQAGKVAFKGAGHPIDGKLTCSSDDKTDTGMIISCRGSTEDGQAAEMTADLGTDSKVASGDRPAVKGASIVGTVDGQQVFKSTCIGHC